MDVKELVQKCLGVYVKYDTRIARQHLDYLELMREVDYVKELSVYYSLNYSKKVIAERVNEGRLLNRDDVIIMNSVFTNIVMSYARCFDTSKSNESRRLIKLSESFLRGVDSSILELHNQLMELRNKVIGHAGISIFVKNELKIGLDEGGWSRVLPGDDNYKVLGGEEVEIDTIEPLLNELKTRLTNKLNVLFKKVEDELGVLDRKQELFLNKLLNNSPITDNDMSETSTV